MKVLTIVLATVCATAAIAASRESDESAVPTIKSLEYAKFDAQARKDNVALAAMFDDALMLVNCDGILWTKAEYLAKAHSGTTSLLRRIPIAMNIKVFGEAAIVVGLYEERGVRSGHSDVRRCRFIDTWMVKKGKWVCIAATESYSQS
jgi:hypothetical protein